ncbi:glycosyltransferase family 4 protein [Lentimicrobium sp.]|jgi:glycosyltransferase involved in cell wall biosynthesis|uniref:glycosyltransferase family 4 protein n=1 Tax=Lentimicrobium sp. TaxID=2034841 RepID=UPI0025D40A3F|nr:glycosyltransferase family 4 protein [Lentimicrobium sp.]MCO5255461.1 glycosyltransferase family 4 protein [Lentimicrobium sp.]HOP12733.1 glycosyltransferase family 4 protein [Lentimicrobium sp.]HPF63198.1 glycosyltransferase family 4 protein [Lentimicrobium sp.]HPR25288.1 glycosyltransferase family 4 protein [Lentimicrobium sp.]HRW68486.1 glycosyltransferase family 4 protein [Lentimicrobium sp.]
MKVLMFGWEFPPHITGGLGTACFGMTKGLLKNGVEVLFVVPKAYGDESQEAVRLINASDVSIDIRRTEELEFWKNITYLEVNSSLVPYVGPEAFDNLMESTEKVTTLSEDSVFNARYTFSGKYGENLLEEVARYALVGAQIARESQFDVIHAHDWLTYAAGVAAKQATGKPLVVHMHATEFDRSGENVNQRVYDIERSGMEAADRVITVSNLTRNIVIDRYGIDPAKVITVHNAVEPTEQFDFSSVEKHVPEKVVTFLGRVTFQKGPEYFIEAAYKVLQRDPNVRFVMAGTGDLLEKMIRRVAQLRISTRFHFTGFLRGENVDRMFAMSDVYVMPSVSEPFGISPLEAMRSNVPVVISKQSGVAEVLQHALKVDFWDIDAMADAIYGLLQYKSLPRMFSKYGAREVNSLKWENAATHIKRVYEQVC